MTAKKTKVLKGAIAAARRNELKKRYKSTILRKTLTKDVMDYVDTLNSDPGVSSGNRIDEYWKENTIALVAHNYFDPSKVRRLSAKVTSPEEVSKLFGLRGLQFGNWLSQEDRYNYLFALTISLHDMKELLNLPFKKLGFNNKLTVAFGARGRGMALAHFEGINNTINMTRYPEVENLGFGIKQRNTKSAGLKYNALLSKGGIGAFSHEWAHALDWNLDGKKHISGGRSNRYKPNPELLKQQSPAGAMERLLFKLNCKADGSRSAWRMTLESKLSKRPSAGDYYTRRTEIFARVFESYLADLLRQKGGQNKFISQPKYQSFVYPPTNLIRKVAPEIRQLLMYYRKMR